MSVVMRVFGKAGEPPLDGCYYLKSFDPDASHSGEYPTGSVEVTSFLSEAKRFESTAEALELWQTASTVCPRRPDGKPNRPLTAYTIQLLPGDKP